MTGIKRSADHHRKRVKVESQLPAIPRPLLLVGQAVSSEGQPAPITANTVLVGLSQIRESDGQLIRHELSRVGGFSRVFPEGTEGGREALAAVGLLACLPQEGAVDSSLGPVCFAQLITGRCDYRPECPLVHTHDDHNSGHKGICLTWLATGRCGDCPNDDLHVSAPSLDSWVATGKLLR